MKRTGTTKKLPANFPTTPEGVAAMLAKAAPPTEDAATVNARWDKAIAVNGGGAKAIREAHAEARRRRGPGKKPAKALISLRIKPDTLERWKATGEGWQTRMAEALDRLP